jgi:hypothetical protein
MACWARARRDLCRPCERLCLVAPEWLLVEEWRTFAANAGGARRATEIRSTNPARDEDILMPPEESEDFNNSS